MSKKTKQKARGITLWPSAFYSSLITHHSLLITVRRSLLFFLFRLRLVAGRLLDAALDQHCTGLVGGQRHAHLVANLQVRELALLLPDHHLAAGGEFHHAVDLLVADRDARRVELLDHADERLPGD